MDTRPDSSPKMYHEIAAWWPLLSRPQDYAEEAEIFRRTFLAADPAIRTLLELGSGGGNNASYLKKHFQMVLVDRSPEMIATSQRLNPELTHFQGDMRSVRLEQTFDAVFIHDAVMYMTSEQDLLLAMHTAAAHLRPGGAVLIVPDHVKETFKAGTDHGGHDASEVGPQYFGRSLRYLEWVYDPDPRDSSYFVDYVYLLHENHQPVQCIYDRHVCGIFPRAKWLELMRAAGFDAHLAPFEHSEVEPGITEMVIGIKL